MISPYFFTVTSSQDENGPGYYLIWARDLLDAREKMFDTKGDKWGFQYTDYINVHPNDRKCIRVIDCLD